MNSAAKIFRSLSRLLLFCLIATLTAAPAWAEQGLKADYKSPLAPYKSKIGLDIYGRDHFHLDSSINKGRLPHHGWLPGDGRYLRNEPASVQYVSRLGYTGLAAAGLAASIASGGVAPAIGFAIVAFVQGVLMTSKARTAEPPKA